MTLCSLITHSLSINYFFLNKYSIIRFPFFYSLFPSVVFGIILPYFNYLSCIKLPELSVYVCAFVMNAICIFFTFILAKHYNSWILSTSHLYYFDKREYFSSKIISFSINKPLIEKLNQKVKQSPNRCDLRRTWTRNTPYLGIRFHRVFNFRTDHTYVLLCAMYK